jgi:hypothetical protein
MLEHFHMEPERSEPRGGYGPWTRFQVTVWYREPTYELVAGPKPEPYFCSYVVTAVDAEHARRIALREFDTIARLSSVGWIRKVVKVEAEELRKAS